MEERLSNRVGQIQSNIRCLISHYIEIEAICFGLRPADGHSGVEGGEQRIADRNRSATPAAKPQTEARRTCDKYDFVCSFVATDENCGHSINVKPKYTKLCQ
jgi:hypothetical protein